MSQLRVAIHGLLPSTQRSGRVVRAHLMSELDLSASGNTGARQRHVAVSFCVCTVVQLADAAMCGGMSSCRRDGVSGHTSGSAGGRGRGGVAPQPECCQIVRTISS